MVTGLRSTARTLIKVNDKSAQVLGRRRNGTWQVDKNPPFDENAEVVIFVDPWAQECQESWGCAPAGFYIAPARETSEHPRPPRRIQGPARRPTSQKPPQQPQRDQTGTHPAVAGPLERVQLKPSPAEDGARHSRCRLAVGSAPRRAIYGASFGTGRALVLLHDTRRFREASPGAVPMFIVRAGWTRGVVPGRAGLPAD